MENIKFSIVENFRLTSNLCDEYQLVKGLNGEKMRKSIEPIRKLFNEGKKEEADELKKRLPAIIAQIYDSLNKFEKERELYGSMVNTLLNALINDMVILYTNSMILCRG